SRPCFLCRSAQPAAVHSLPTRRSSDLSCTTAAVAKISAAQSTAKSQLNFANFGRIAENQPTLHKEIDHGGGSLRKDKRCHQRVGDRKSTRLNSSHVSISYAVFCLTKKT